MKAVEKQEKKKWTKSELVEYLCQTGVYVFLFLLVAVYSFYSPEGYIQIATNRYLFFRKMSLSMAWIMIPLVVLHYILWFLSKEPDKKKPEISLTDIFMLQFLVVNVFSYFGTNYKNDAIWGTTGWNIGFATHLIFIGMYFMISRFYDGKIDVLPFFMAVLFIIFLWGILNRFSIYPIDMQYNDPSFISSMGNINWFSGFWAVFCAVGVALYIVTEKRRMRIYSGIFSVISLALGAVEGSDSAFVSIAVVFFFLFLISFQKTEYMKRWLEECIFFFGSCQVMRLITIIFPENLNRTEGTIALMLSNITLAALIVFGALRILLEMEEKKNTIYTKKGKKVKRKDGEPELIEKYKWIKNAAVRLVAAVSVIFLAMIIINTIKPGSLGPLSNYSVFLFNREWGSKRGSTWMDGLLSYQSMSWTEKMFGVGQDCFSAYGYSVPELAARFEEDFPGQRLTNAHNECITYLVNLGGFGLIAFIGIFWSSIKGLMEKAAKDPVCYMYAACLLSYFFHNQFSFSQMLCTPYAFMMIGLAESQRRRAGRLVLQENNKSGTNQKG